MSPILPALQLRGKKETTPAAKSSIIDRSFSFVPHNRGISPKAIEGSQLCKYCLLYLTPLISQRMPLIPSPAGLNFARHREPAPVLSVFSSPNGSTPLLGEGLKRRGPHRYKSGISYICIISIRTMPQSMHFRQFRNVVGVSVNSWFISGYHKQGDIPFPICFGKIFRAFVAYNTEGLVQDEPFCVVIKRFIYFMKSIFLDAWKFPLRMV